ncbi:MAG: hypothetical protein CMO32_43270 [Variovorax sp.]|nr:hypothetical protein [Variovorax sp.]
MNGECAHQLVYGNATPLSSRGEQMMGINDAAQGLAGADPFGIAFAGNCAGASIDIRLALPLDGLDVVEKFDRKGVSAEHAPRLLVCHVGLVGS